MTSQEFLTWLLQCPSGRSHNSSIDLPIDAVPGAITELFKTAIETLVDLNCTPQLDPKRATGKIKQLFDDMQAKLGPVCGSR